MIDSITQPENYGRQSKIRKGIKDSFISKRCKTLYNGEAQRGIFNTGAFYC